MPRMPVEQTCPGPEDIAAFLRGCLAPQHMGPLEAHVADCSACRQLLSVLARVAATGSGPVADTASPTLPLESSASETALLPGTRFGRYVVLSWLGAGGMGVVYAAYDPELNRKVALKVLGNDCERPADRRPVHDVLLREAQAMAQLAHPNVVAVFDVGSVDDRVFIAMELVEGLTLAKWLATERRQRSAIIAVFLAAGAGLAAAHAAGLIHRDFKPDNVLIGNDGRVRVTDFGLARAAPQPFEAAHRGAAAPGRGAGTTQTGLAGTLAYMAPEQFLGRSVDARADQFSFAVACYEALYGERLFSPGRFSPTDGADLRHEVVPPRRGGVPLALRQVLSRALRPDPDERYPSMRELLEALAPRPRRGRMIAVGAILMVVALGSAGAYAIHLRHAAEQRTRLVGRLRGVGVEMRTMLRSAQLLPVHDIRPAREQVRTMMRDVERQLQAPAGQDEIALIHFVLGEGHRALGDHDRALSLLEAAWAEGERGLQIDAALGAALGAAYESRLNEIERTVPASQRNLQIRDIEARYRSPAMRHLRAALAAKASSPAYLEALIAFHERRFVDSFRRAHQALSESPTFYEAGVLEAKAHHEAARELQSANRISEANTEYADARRVFESVLEIARSDDEAWLAYSRMVFKQALWMTHGGLLPELRNRAVAVLGNARQIDPDRWDALLREAEIYQQEANFAIIGSRDPGADADKVLALASEARARGADRDQVEVLVCLAHWERARYQGDHGVDPHAAFQQAIAACESSAAARPDADRYESLGTVYLALATYQADHGDDPTHAFELSKRNFYTAVGIDDSAELHYCLGVLWTKVAHYQASHGWDPRGAVDHALTELETTVQKDATRGDAWAGMSDVLIARARFQRAMHEDTRPGLTQAHTALDRALAIEAGLVPPIKDRIMLAELDAEALLERHVDPSSTVRQMRADAQLVLRSLPDDRFAHRFWCLADLLAARWALAQREAVDHVLAHAATEAAQARAADPTDALAWTVSAEVEQLRAEAARAHGSRPDAAILRGLAFISHAMSLDPRLVHALKVRDELAR
jgi:tetratricopeptide (TPR) repeat protein/predicted Ser/Thr protein kinase